MKNEFGTEMTFYLLLSEHHGPNKGLERFQTLDEAIRKFKDAPKDLFAAIVGDINGMAAIDFAHRNYDMEYLIMDYAVADHFKNREDISEIISKVRDELALQYYFESSFSPYSGVVGDIHDLREKDQLNDYYEDKLLYSPNVRNLNAGINEVLIMNRGNSFSEAEYMGWNGAQKFYEAFDKSDELKQNLYVHLVNVSYVETTTGYHGQADISPRDFHLLKEKTREYLKQHGKYPIAEQLQNQYRKRTSSEYER